MGMGRKNEIDMTSGPLLGKILVFLVPLILSSTLQLLFNAADIIVVGRYVGSEALAAVGSNTSLIALFTNIFIGLSIGANVVAAKYLGAGRDADTSDTVHTSVAIAVLGGVFLLITGVIFSGPMLKLMGTPDEIVELARLYLRIYFCGMPAFLLYNFGAALLRAVGDTQRPLIYLLIAGFINLVLNLFFVISLGLGVVGVGLATVISQCISTYLVIRCLIRTDGAMRLYLRRLKISRDRLWEIVRVGVPAGLQGIVFSVSNVLIQSSINSFGAVAVAGNTAAANIEGFVYMAMNASYQACVSFTGQNYGARKPDRILKTLFWCQITGVVTGLILGWPAWFFGKQLMGLYSADSSVIAFGLRRMGIILTTYFLCEVMDVPVGTLRGMGYGLLPMTISLIGACLFRVIWIFTIFQVVRTPEILYISYPISWVITAAAQLTAIRLVWKRHWPRIKK